MEIVLRHVENGESLRTLASEFNTHHSSIALWVKQYRQASNLQDASFDYTGTQTNQNRSTLPVRVSSVGTSRHVQSAHDSVIPVNYHYFSNRYPAAIPPQIGQSQSFPTSRNVWCPTVEPVLAPRTVGFGSHSLMEETPPLAISSGGGGPEPAAVGVSGGVRPAAAFCTRDLAPRPGPSGAGREQAPSGHSLCNDLNRSLAAILPQIGQNDLIQSLPTSSNIGCLTDESAIAPQIVGFGSRSLMETTPLPISSGGGGLEPAAVGVSGEAAAAACFTQPSAPRPGPSGGGREQAPSGDAPAPAPQLVRCGSGLVPSDVAPCLIPSIDFSAGHAVPADSSRAISNDSISCPSSTQDDVLVQELDQSLRSRVIQRATTQNDANRILKKLLQADCYSIAMLEDVMSISGCLKSFGFDQEEADMLLFDDAKWNSRHAWLDTFIDSLPHSFKDSRLTERTKKLILQDNTIKGINDLVRLYKNIDLLPGPIRFFIEHKYYPPTKPSEHDFQLQSMAMGSEASESSFRALADAVFVTGSAETGSVAGPESHVSTARRNAVESLALLQSGNHGPKIDTSFEDLCNHVRIAFSLFPAHTTNQNGVSGTVQPRATMNLLVSGHSTLCEAHPVKSVRFVDMGCGCGHAVFAACMSGKFESIMGVDLPENKDLIEQNIMAFQHSAANHASLARYKEKFANVQFCWKDCGQGHAEDFDSLLGEDDVTPAMVYWFCSGWSANDIRSCAKMISGSQRVLCVICLPRRQGAEVERLLLDLNSSPGKKRFYIHHKARNVPMSGSSRHTACIFLRRSEYEFNLETRPEPVPDQEVEVIYADPLQWFRGRVKNFDRVNETVSILFEDGEKRTFGYGEPGLVFSPTEDNQWRIAPFEAAGPALTGRPKFCNFCTERVDGTEFCCCSRCRITTYHLKCLDPRSSAEFLCPPCRAELAGYGRFQVPQSLFLKKGSSYCFSCTSPISTLHKRKQAHLCRLCNASFGICCSSRTRRLSFGFTCPACIGISAHDEALEYCFDSEAAHLHSILQLGRDQGKMVDFMDEYALAFSSLQDTCQWELLEKNLPSAVQLLQHQIEKGEDPSLGPFHLINLLGMDKGPDYDLVDKATRLYVQHAGFKARAGETERGCKAGSVVSEVSKKSARRIGYVTADMRRTPWWQLSKVQLLDLAEESMLFLYSRPCIQLPDDPHYEALRKLCTIIEFKEGTCDSAVAERVRKDNLDVLIDAGGPTLGSFTGVMCLLPEILRGAHLGYPGTQSGGHIDFSVVDQYIVPPCSEQEEKAEEALLFMSCYQPNDLWPCSVSVRYIATQTSRSDWNLPEDAFVFGFFCRLQRISKPLAKALADILNRAEKCVLWMRSKPQVAFLRVKKFFRAAGIKDFRLIAACDVPNEEHRERLRHANAVLDSHIFGGHTTASDALLAGVPFLALRGKWWHARVSASLLYNMLGSDVAEQLVCPDLKLFVEKAVLFATTGRAQLEVLRAQLRTRLESRTGICDGPRWMREFLRGLDELIGQHRSKRGSDRLTDVFVCPLINFGCSRRTRKFLADAMPVSKRRFREQDGEQINSKKARGMEIGLEGGSAMGSHDDNRSKAQKHRLGWLFEMAKTDPETARKAAYDYLMQTMPAGREIAQYQKPDGTWMWAIQLPCITSWKRLGSQKIKEIELPLLYVSKRDERRGSELFGGQNFESGMYMTSYDGRLMGTDQVTDKTHVISLSFSSRLAIDSGRIPDWKLVECCSLGGKTNHSYSNSNVKYTYKDWISPISQYTKSILLQAKGAGKAHDVLLGYYTAGAAERDHGILRHPVAPGIDYIHKDSETWRRVPDLVSNAMEVLRKHAGFDLIKICGCGSFGLVVQVGQQGDALRFAVKIGKRPIHQLTRLGGLVEAALLLRATRSKDQSIGIFYPTLCTQIGWGSSAAALLRVNGDLVSAVAMECADSDADRLWRKFGQRFMSDGDETLLPDQQSFLRGIITAAAWMHQSGFAHGDLKPSNILLKRLEGDPKDSRVAFCKVQDSFYKIVFGDWGHARWSGRSKDCFHLFTSGPGTQTHNDRLFRLEGDRRSINVIQARTLDQVFGHQLLIPCSFPHPGPGTVTFRAPDPSPDFQAGEGRQQRLFDQAGDLWAIGVISVRVIAPPRGQDSDLEKRDWEWSKSLQRSSRNANTLQSGKCSASLRKRGNQAVQQALSQPEDRGSWIATMVRTQFQDRWVGLSGHLSGRHGSVWLLLLQLQEGLLTYSSEERLNAGGALQHDFFRTPC